MIPYDKAMTIRAGKKPSRSMTDTREIINKLEKNLKELRRDCYFSWHEGHQAALISIGITLQLDCPDDGNYTVASICDEIEKRMKS